MKKHITFLIFLFVQVINSVIGQSIWTNQITDPNPSLSNPFNAGEILSPNLAASGVGRGSGIAAAAGVDRYNASSWNSLFIDFSAYFEFNIQPTNGCELNFTSFVYTGQVSATGPTSFSLRSSDDNYTTDIGTATATGTTIDLTAPAYQNLTSTIRFRIYAWGASASSGAFSINNFTFNGNVCGIILPIQLIDFTAESKNDEVVLSWMTLSELNNDFFTVERSVDGDYFEPIGSTNSKGNGNEMNEYYEVDQNPPMNTLTYYRLKQTDFNGAYTYSEIVSVRPSQQTFFYANEFIYAYINSSLEHDCSFRIFNLNGELLLQTDLAINEFHKIPWNYKGVFILDIPDLGVSYKIIAY